MIWRIHFIKVVVTLLTVWIIHTHVILSAEGVKSNKVEFWAKGLGELLNSRCNNASRIKDLRGFYQDATTIPRRFKKVKTINGLSLVISTTERIRAYLKVRYDAVKSIKLQAENAFITQEDENVTFTNGCNSYQYYNAKTLQIYKPRPTTAPPLLDENSTWTPQQPNRSYQLPLYENWSDYYRVPVSLNSSAIHIPTNVYECSPTILKNISWSESIDDVFIQNYDSIPRSWQYYASSDGFLRYFPASKWLTQAKEDNEGIGIDMFDARLTEWYTQAATLPKSVVILLDVSGSMKGLRLEIAMKTVSKLFETLHENDFFNLIIFRNETLFVDPCEMANGTLLQATNKNKQRLLDALKDIPPIERADFSLAFTLAFDVLIQANATQIAGPHTNNAIMVVTDGAPEGYKQVFEKYNWFKNESLPNGFEKWVRVFSYLIGQEVTASNREQVEWMACANKGYFYHIATMSDVHDFVQDYVRVMARPLVIHDVPHSTWTGVHVNTPLLPAGSQKGHHAPVTDEWKRLPSTYAGAPQLTISVAMPVYDMTRDIDVKNQGRLLGVAGTDVFISEILDLIPQPKLGVHGYSFIINNNGFVIVHPDFAPWVEAESGTLWSIIIEGSDLKVNHPKPDYKNVDISYLEQELDPTEGRVMQMREAMINGSTGSITIKVKKFYDKSFTRAYVITQTYHYSSIAGTPYSLCLVTKEPSDNKQVMYTGPLLRQDLDTCRAEVAPWKYCAFTQQDLYTNNKSVIKLIQDMLDKPDYKDRCDEELLQALMFDAHVTKGMLAAWLDEWTKHNTWNEDTRPCMQTDSKERERCEFKKTLDRFSRLLDIDMILLGTRSGLTRYQELLPTDSMLTDVSSNVIETCPAYTRANIYTSIESEYYKKAARAPQDIWNFDIKVPANSEMLEFNSSLITVTASQGVYMKHSPDVNNLRDYDNILMSVISLSINYTSLYDMVMKTTMNCLQNSMPDCINKTGCEDEDVDCYLLDDNGYIVMAEGNMSFDKLGQSFGSVDYQVMIDLTDQGIFQQIDILDYQALCAVCITSQSSASRLLDPFRYLSSVLWWTISKTAIFLLEFSLFDWSQYIYYATASSDIFNPQSCNFTKRDTDIAVPCVKDNLVFIPNDDLNTPTLFASGLIEECLICRVYNHENAQEQLTCNETLQRVTTFDVGVDENRTEICRPSEEGSYCDRSYAVHKVPGTNLYLLVLEANCRCQGKQLDYCMEEHEIYRGCSEDTLNRYRRPPDTLMDASSSTPNPSSRDKFYTVVRYNTNSRKKNKKIRMEENRDCGRGSLIQVTLTLLLTCSLLLLLL